MRQAKHILLTGNRGVVGRVVERELARRGFGVTGFDVRDGLDVRNPKQLQRAITGCDAVVHLAAVPRNEKRRKRQLHAVNVIGTKNVLLAAVEADVQRVVYMSSVNALGIFSGEGTPDYLPIDDDHPARPRSDYGVSKLAGEELCRVFTETHGLTTICLRPPAVWDKHAYERAAARDHQGTSDGRRPGWEYGAFIDVRDLATAVACALDQPPSGHVRLLLCADDVCSGGETSRELARALLPGVEWRNESQYDGDPQRALVDTSRARLVLGWSPAYGWGGFKSEAMPGPQGSQEGLAGRSRQILRRLIGLS